ncbi:MAG: hypothetical protein VKK43_02610, partial [Synechococcaceae cyanobacterium]|nr:hypothetical protein [Synechococcaceae cyanobacterium]
SSLGGSSFGGPSFGGSGYGAWDDAPPRDDRFAYGRRGDERPAPEASRYSERSRGDVDADDLDDGYGRIPRSRPERPAPPAPDPRRPVPSAMDDPWADAEAP